MAGVKRKSLDDTAAATKVKKTKTAKPGKANRAVKPPKPAAKKVAAPEPEDDLIESDTSEDENGFYGFSASAPAEDAAEDDDFETFDEETASAQPPSKRLKALAEQDKVAKKGQYKDNNGHLLGKSLFQCEIGTTC